MSQKAPRVLISYAQGDAAHSEWVRRLADRLLEDGVAAVIDQYVTWPEEGWRRWMSQQITQADCVLVVCTAEYRRRFEGDERVPSDVGRGVRWESQHITQSLYDAKFRNRRFVPVLPPGASDDDIPLPLQDYDRFRPGQRFELNEGDRDRDSYSALYRLLTGQPLYAAPSLGRLRRLPPLTAPAEPGPATPSADAAPPAAFIPNPYPGLAAFTEQQAKAFFGRDEDIPRVADKLMGGHFACVVGRSGTGKSSLVAAGVLPALRRQFSNLHFLRFTPQSDPLARLADAIDRLVPEERLRGREPRALRISGELRADPAAAIARHFASLAPALVFADQFEELFTQTPEAARAGFKALFDALRGSADLYVVLTARSEFFAQLADWLGGMALESGQVLLDPITGEARYRAVIERPALDCGVAIEEALVTELAATVSSMAGALPLLALTLQRLFAGRDPDRGITLAAYQATGGLAESVRRAAAPVDEAIDADPALAVACKGLFAALATAVEGIPARRTAEVAPLRVDPATSRLIDDLRAQGLLADPDDAHIEIAHETLFTHWPRLKAWCDDHALFLARRREAEQAACDWDKATVDARRDGSAAALRHAEILRWVWERQKPALEAMLALGQLQPVVDPDFIDPGIYAWRALEGELAEPLKSFLYPEPLRLLDELASDATPHIRREDIGRRLNAMTDPRRGVGLNDQGLPDIVWENIEAGEVTLETDPPQTFPVAPFRIARYPVTWMQYRAFVEADDGYRDARWWKGLKPETGEPGDSRWAFDNHPAINVSWYDAVAFCRWLTDRLGLTDGEIVQLPTEWEWQWVAQAGQAALEYPWGVDWHPARANSFESGVGRTLAVGLYPFGCPGGKRVSDLAGNVWEWCLNEDSDRRARFGLGHNALRGGSWNDGPENCRAAKRTSGGPENRGDDLGFRLCRGSPIDPPDAEPRSR